MKRGLKFVVGFVILISLVFLIQEISAQDLLWSKTSNPTSGSDTAHSVVSDGSYVYVSGVDRNSGTGVYAWRIQKRNLFDGGIVWEKATGDLGSTSLVGIYGDLITIDDTYVYMAGYSGETDKQWRIEKRRKSDGGVEWTQTVNPSGSSDIPESITSDDTYIYIVGYDLALGGLNMQWRIEKRRKSDGGVVWTQTSNPTGNEDVAYAVTESGNYLYIAGFDQTPGAGNYEFRIEKRRKSDGGVEWTQTSNPTTNRDQAQSITSDSTYIYVGGFDNGVGGDMNWRIEKRRQSDGGVVWTQTVNPFTGLDQIYSMINDNNYLYTTGIASYSPGGFDTYEWRIEKRRKSDGGVEWTQTSNPSAGIDYPYSIGTDGCSLYIVGSDKTPGNDQWKIEKRHNIDEETDAAFCTRLGKECGSVTALDNCGVSRTNVDCGNCVAPETCSAGVCQYTCTPSCVGKECGDNGCGVSCGSCTAPETCSAGVCSCTPSCVGKECGDNGCGVSCGSCTLPEKCASNNICKVPCKTCESLGKECGVWPDGCGGTLFCWADTYPYSFSYESSWYASENKETRGVATDGNFMWVVDRRTSMVYKYTMNGTYTEESFNSGIVDGQGGITTDGNFIWILDRVVDSVRKYTMNGTYTGEFWFPAGDVYGNKDVFGITTDGNFIWVVDGNFEGEHIRKYTMGGVYLGEYWDYSGPNFVDITTDGNYFWIINEGNAILRYDFEGVRESEYSQVLADWEAGYQNAPLGITTYGDSLYVVGQREWAPSSNVWVYNYTKLWGEYRCDYGKMCSIDGTCISEIPYWVDMKGNAIGQTIGKQAQIGDTVLMIYKDKAGGDYDFIIKEKDVINNDDIRTVTGVFNFGSDLAAKWTITKEDFDLGNPSSDLGLEGNTEELYFTVDNKISDELWVDKNSINNILPSTQIINPKYKEVYVINEATGKTTDIPFKQISSDPDDDLKLTWEFGDGTNQSFENIKTGLGNTSHSYTTPGTKTIRLTAQEMSPRAAAQSASDTTEIYVYKEGVIVFAIITQPNPDEIQEINSRFVKINASATHAVNCSYNLAKCQASAPSPGDCITYNDKITNYPIYCYRFPQAAQDKMKIEWTFDNNPNKLTGEYGAGKTKVVGFVKIFDEPGKHTLNLKASYTTP